jgi:hypothetical protein
MDCTQIDYIDAKRKDLVASGKQGTKQKKNYRKNKERESKFLFYR